MTRTLLIVDDIKSNRMILKNLLNSDYYIIEAENGQEALAVMASEYQRISAVLLDLGMPVMDGYEVLSCMQESERLSQLPVIVTTGQTDADAEEKALTLGAKDYIAKPYKSAIIKQRIRNTIKLRETAAAMNALQRDRLTGLLSRDTFFEKVSAMTSAREPGYYTLACFDVNKFKVINDQYGTGKGDDVLRHIARVFQSGFDANGGICCRVSADDFAVLYPTSLQTSEILAELRREASAVDGLASPLGFSIGRYAVFDVSLSPSAMYDRAMLAADSVKGRYDSSIAVYDESMRSHLLHEQEIVTEMEAALAEKQFVLWYQPQYNHSTGALIGCEALVRWNHPKKGLIPPCAFIPVFEQNGFIYSLDKYVWEEACVFLKKELEAGRSPLPVSVNISRYDVFSPDFLETVAGLVKKYDIEPSLLRLEITESAFAESTNHIVSVAKQLIAAGFTLEIDDFGSGYSSLNTLKNVPAQVLKLDMQFLRNDDDSQRGGNIIESIVRMSKWLGMSVIAEGVENAAQADFLRSIGCNYIQGYLYAMPMPEEDYRRLCSDTGKEEKLLVMETVENLDNNSFWDPESMDTLIFNSYVGAACIFEYHNGNIELLRATEKYARVMGSAGMTIEDALKLNWSAHLSEEDSQRVIDNLEKSIRKKREVTGEYVFLDLPGCPHETYLRSTMRVIASSQDRRLVYCTNENITAQRKAEQREREISEQLKSVLDNVACGITAVQLDGEKINYLITNNKYYEILGYSVSQYISEVGDHAFKAVVPEDKERVRATANKVMASGKPCTMEYRALRRNGQTVWLRSIISMASFEGVSGKIQISTYTDITEQKRAERELMETTEQLRTMMDDIPGGFARTRVDSDGRIIPVYFSKGFLKLIGRSREELASLYADDVFSDVHPDDLSIVKGAMARMIKNGEARSSRYRLLNSSGKYVCVTIFGRMARDADGRIFLNIYYSDATEQAHEEAQQKEILDNLPYGVALFELNAQGLSVIHLNKRYWELVDRTEVSYSESAFLNAVYPEDRNIITFELASAIRENRDCACDIRVLYRKDQYRPFHIAGRILRKSDGKYYIFAAYTPISDQEMSVQEILPIALGAMMEYQKDYTFVKDKNLRYVCCSREMSRLVGLTEADMQGKSDYELFGRDIAEGFETEDRRILESGESLIENIDRLPSKDGSVHYSCTSKFPLRDSQGNVVGIYGTGHDVTETRTIRSQLELLTNSIPGGIATCQYQAGSIHIVYFNDGFCGLFEIERDAHLSLSEQDICAAVFEEDLPSLKKQVDELITSGFQLDCVFRFRLKNGYKWINIKASVQECDNNKVIFNAVLFDVTQRQEDMERLRISEEENRLAMQHTPTSICRYDVATGSLRIPASTQRKFSLCETIENVPEDSIASGAISPETQKVYRAFYEAIHQGEKTGSVTFRRKLNSGWCSLEAHFSTIFSDVGKPVSAVISFTDITEQLKKDSAYKRWHQSLLDKAPGSYSLFRCTISKKTSFETMEGSLLNMNFTPGMFDFDERTVQYANTRVFCEDRERFCAFLNSDALLSGYYRGNRNVSLEYREKLAGGEHRWLRLTVDLLEHSRFYDIEGYLLFEDIDKAKRLELATIEQAETDPLTGVMNRAAFASRVDHIIKTSDPNTRHAMLMLDIDGFKQVNDVFGHGAGDQALIDISSTLVSALRRGDLVGRLGGDEFMIFLADIPGDVVAASKAAHICALSRRSFSAEIEISGSIGITVAPRDGTDFESLYKKADAALYYVKGSGKNSYTFYHENMADEHLLPERNEPILSEAVPRKKKRRMLIVDDNRMDHALLANIFNDEFIIDKTKDGSSALIRLQHYGTAISVVLLDLMMPGMDGFAVLKKMQESAELRSVPVIVVSGDNSRETALRAIREGAVDFVNKPVDPEILRIRVQSAISKADNERLRAKNNLLEYQNNEVLRYRAALEHSGIVMIEHDWVVGSFAYDHSISEYIAGAYDKRGLWHILLSDLVADTYTVKKMQEAVQRIALDKKSGSEKMLVRLKTPSMTLHWFTLNIYKVVNVFGLAGKIFLSFIDLGAESPEQKPQV